MPNTDPEAVRVANEEIRTMADALMQLYNRCKAFQTQGIAQGWMALFPADTQEIVDGSAIDGRQPITNQNARDIVLQASTYIIDMEASTNERRTQASIVSVNPERSTS